MLWTKEVVTHAINDIFKEVFEIFLIPLTG